MPDFTAKLLSTPAFRSTRRQALTLREGSPFDALDQEIADVGAAIADVRARMAPYASQITYDREKASEGSRAMRAWANDHASLVQSLPPDSPLPPEAVARLPRDQARAWISYLYIESVDGYPLMTSGAYKRAIAAGTVTLQDAKDDLEGKRRALQLLTALDEQGSITAAFATPVNGLGAAPAIAIGIGIYELLIIAGVAIVGLLTYYYYTDKAADRALLARDKLCDQAQKDNDTDTVAKCRNSILNAAAAAAEKPWDPINVAIAVIGGVGLIYLLTDQVLPKYLSGRSSSESS